MQITPASCLFSLRDVSEPNGSPERILVAAIVSYYEQLIERFLCEGLDLPDRANGTQWFERHDKILASVFRWGSLAFQLRWQMGIQIAGDDPCNP